MPKPKRRCDECESLYFSEASQMMSLCPECSHLLYDYPNCQHKFENGSCVNCGWDGSRSEYLKGQLQRHNMSDDELKDELAILEGRMNKLSRLKEVKALMSEIAPPPLVMVAIGCNWRTPECEGARDGLLDLKVLLNESFVVRVEIPNDLTAKVEHARPYLLSDYLLRGTASERRQIGLTLA